MEGDFYRDRLQGHGIEVIIPGEFTREVINSIIFKELCLGIFRPESKQRFQQIIRELQLEGAEGVVLGCTEIPLLIKQDDVEVPVFDTMTIHAAAAIVHALGR